MIIASMIEGMLLERDKPTMVGDCRSIGEEGRAMVVEVARECW